MTYQLKAKRIFGVLGRIQPAFPDTNFGALYTMGQSVVIEDSRWASRDVRPVAMTIRSRDYGSRSDGDDTLLTIQNWVS